GAGNDGTADALGCRFRLRFVPQKSDGTRRRSNECQPAAFADRGEIGIFAQKTISWMDSVGAGDFTGSDNVWDLQIGFYRRGLSDTNSLIGLMHMQSVRIPLRIDGDCLESKIMTGPDDPDSDLSTICNENFMHTITRYGTSWCQI